MQAFTVSSIHNRQIFKYDDYTFFLLLWMINGHAEFIANKCNNLSRLDHRKTGGKIRIDNEKPDSSLLQQKSFLKERRTIF